MTTILDLGRTHQGQMCPDCERVMSHVDESMVCPLCGQVAERLYFGNAALQLIARTFFDPYRVPMEIVPPPVYEQDVLL